MTANRFGGVWTTQKLQVLREYLQFYCIALSQQPYRLVYIDAFAGTGRCHIQDRQGEQMIDGSATIALNCSPGFHDYRFIEKKRKHILELEQLLKVHPNGHKARIVGRTAEDVLQPMLIGYNWKTHRGVLFLDPFGLQCSYQMLKVIAATKALDVFFLVSLSGLYRQATVKESDVDEGKANCLTNFLGTRNWRDVLYTNVQADFFADDQRTRARGWEHILKFTTERLRELFPYVGTPNLMLGPNGAPLFALYFAVSNDKPAAIGLAQRVSKEILSKLQR